MEGRAEGSGGGRSWEENTEDKVRGGKTGEHVRSLRESCRGTFGQCMGIAGMVGGWAWLVGRSPALCQPWQVWTLVVRVGRTEEDRGHTGISQALPPLASNGKELLRSEVCLPSSS